MEDDRFLFAIIDIMYFSSWKQGLTIIAFNKAKFNSKTIRELLSLGPTYIVMMFFQSKSLQLKFVIFWNLNIFMRLFTWHFFLFYSFYRCSWHTNDVWCLCYIWGICGYSNLLSFYLVHIKFDFCLLPLCVCFFDHSIFLKLRRPLVLIILWA